MNSKREYLAKIVPSQKKNLPSPESVRLLLVEVLHEDEISKNGEFRGYSDFRSRRQIGGV